MWTSSNTASYIKLLSSTIKQAATLLYIVNIDLGSFSQSNVRPHANAHRCHEVCFAYLRFVFSMRNG
jgi:hypothetical protein